MYNDFDQLVKDIGDFDLPKDLDAYDRVTCALVPGKRIYWFYQLDADYFEEMGEDPKDYHNDIYSGIVVPRPGIEYNSGELNAEDVIIVSDQQPTEKDYPETFWITLGRLLNDSDLVEVFE